MQGRQDLGSAPELLYNRRWRGIDRLRASRQAANIAYGLSPVAECLQLMLCTKGSGRPGEAALGERMARAMQVPLQIAFHGLESSEATRGLIEEKVNWLEQFHDRIIACQVVVEVPHRKHRRGNNYLVRIDLTVPGGEIVVNRKPAQHVESKDLILAIRDAFDAARRLLEEHLRRRQGEVKTHLANSQAE
jgi:ribosomal subunit interface protein